MAVGKPQEPEKPTDKKQRAASTQRWLFSFKGMGQNRVEKNGQTPHQLRTTQPIEPSFDGPASRTESFQYAPACAASTTSEASRQDETTRHQAGTDASRPTHDALSAILPTIIERASSFGVGSGRVRVHRILLPLDWRDRQRVVAADPL
jgi:hypothetical protein